MKHVLFVTGISSPKADLEACVGKSLQWGSPPHFGTELPAKDHTDKCRRSLYNTTKQDRLTQLATVSRLG